MKSPTSKHFVFQPFIDVSQLLGVLVILIPFLIYSCQSKNDLSISAEDDFKLGIGNVSILPSVLNEASGLESSGENLFWCHNDRGGEPIVYGLDSLGQMTRSILLTDARNEDWEDLALSEDGTLYIGDFGNNDNDRNDLVIYKVGNMEEANSNAVTAETIHFELEDQFDFPPDKSDFLFDVEGIFVFGTSLYLFIKDRSNPFLGETKMYTLPSDAGYHTARLIGRISTASKKKEGAITGADISPDGKTVALLSNENIFLFTDFEFPNIFDGRLQKLSIPSGRQTEGVVFMDSCNLYLSSEEKGNVKPLLQKISICN